MNEINFFDKVFSVVKMIVSSSFFIALLLIIIATVAVFILNDRIDSKKKPFLKVIIGFVYALISGFIFYKYGNGILLVGDAFIEKLFTAIYFPNIISYMCMLIIALLLMVITFINKRLNRALRICNIVSFFTIGFLFILIIDAISNFNVNVYDKVSIYSNESLMILIQSSMGVFVIWLSIIVVNFLVTFITCKISHEDYYLNLNVDDIVPYSEEEFEHDYIKYKNNMNYQDYLDIINNRNSWK